MGAWYRFTNESLDAIIGSMDLTPDDGVISICGSGAQPFAFLEYLTGNGKVLAIDISREQISFAKKIIKIIKKKDVESLREINLAPKNPGHFTNEKRLNLICANLDKLDFAIDNVELKPIIRTKFSKGYFSNAPVDLKKNYSLFTSGALIYVVFSSEDIPVNIEKFLDKKSEDWECDVRALYNVDISKTKYACKLESLHPYIYHNSIYPPPRRMRNFNWKPVVFVKK